MKAEYVFNELRRLERRVAELEAKYDELNDGETMTDARRREIERIVSVRANPPRTYTGFLKEQS